MFWSVAWRDKCRSAECRGSQKSALKIAVCRLIDRILAVGGCAIFCEIFFSFYFNEISKFLATS